MSTRRAAQLQASEGDADPEYLALNSIQKRNIDKAFDRGLAQLSRKRSTTGKKKRKGNDGSAIVSRDEDGVFTGEGGFMEAGGFMEDDAGGGGFLPEDDGGGFFSNNEGQDSGGFLPGIETPSGDGDEPAKVSLRIIPQLLNVLGLPFDDDVLEVFKASASGWGEDDTGIGSRRRTRDKQEEELGVERKDFRAVCAALMGPMPEGQGEDIEMSLVDDADEGGGSDAESDDDEEEDVYQEDEESSLSSLSSDSEYGASKAKGKGKGKVRATGRSSAASDTPAGKPTRKNRKALEEQGTIKLSSRQKDVVKDIWDMLKPNSSGRGNYILGREEVKALVRSLGEMWTEEEITDMVKLFSSQHEGRGLSFDDFGVVMVRAGLA